MQSRNVNLKYTIHGFEVHAREITVTDIVEEVANTTNADTNEASAKVC